MAKLTPAEMVTAVENEEALALDTARGELQAQRTDALDRYLGRPYGTEQDGRSSVVDRSIADTVEWIMPSLMRTFLGGDEIGKFAATGPEDEGASDIETQVCNHFVMQRSDAFSHFSAAIRDALLLKNGYLIGMWAKRTDKMTETYTGLSPEEATLLAQDADVTVVEHTERPDPIMGVVHDCKVERKKADEFPAIESIPPDEIVVSRRQRWTSLLDADFVQWRRRVSIGQLRAEGFEVPDDAPNDDESSQEQSARERFGGTFDDDDQTNDPSRRLVMFKDTYLLIDRNGTGIPQLWRVAIIDGDAEPTLMEEADIIPFAAFSPIVYPHSHIGTSVYDLISDLALVKTTLLRQYLDGVYLQNNGRVAVADGVNLDDLMVNRPGGIVRVDGMPGEKIMPLVTPDVTGSVLQGLQYVDSIKEQRTGVRAWTEGMGSASLHPTATGVQSVDSAAAQRIELIARTLASGFRDLFLIVHRLVSKHSTKPIQIKLNNAWQVIDPRSWATRTDFTISVGLGVGTPDAQLMKLQALAPMLAQAMQMGLAGPQEAYNYGEEVLKAAGYRNADKFLHPPKKDPQTGEAQMPPPPKDPMVQTAEIKAQADGQMEQARMANDAQRFQAEQAAKGQELQMQDQMKMRELQANLELQRSNDQRAYELQLQKHNDDVQLQREKMVMEANVKIEVAKISRGADEGLEAAKTAASEAHEMARNTSEAVGLNMAQLLPQLEQMLAQHRQAMAEHAAMMGKRRH